MVPKPIKPIFSGIACGLNGIQLAMAAIKIKKKLPGKFTLKYKVSQCTATEKNPKTTAETNGLKLKLTPTVNDIINPKEQTNKVSIRFARDDFAGRYNITKPAKHANKPD